MTRSKMLVPFAVALLAACGAGEDAAGDGAATDTMAAPADMPPPPAGTVDTAGMGTNPPTAGGQLVDTAAVPGPVDTAQGTPTAP